MSAVLAVLGKVPLWVWIALLAAGVIVVQHLEVKHAKAQIIALNTETDSLKASAYANLTTIAKLEAANKQWASKDAADLALGKTYADAAEQYSQQMQAQRNAAQTTIQRIYTHDPSARQWAALPVPVGIADSLRANAGSSL